MRSCSSCGAPAKPGEKFCGQCGSPLGPDDSPSSIPSGGTRSRNILVVVAVLVLVLIGAAAGFILMKGHGNAATGASNQSSAPGSYVIIQTEEPVTTVATTVLPTVNITETLTTSPTTAVTTKVRICPADRRLCNNTCADIRTDSRNCGSCGNACPSGQSCVSGTCMMSCSSGQTACAEGCFNLNTDPDHCGTCNNNCPAGLICSSGQCSPPPTIILTSI